MSNELVEETLAAANVLLRVAARTVVEVEDKVTSPQLRVLVLIAHRGPQTPTAVGIELDVHPSNSIRICRRIERAGYIAAVRSEEDRRSILFSLTPAGTELVSAVLERRRAGVVEVLNRLDDNDRRTALAGFHVFASAASDPGDEDGRFSLIDFTEAHPPRK
jgi:DNA-binding MarR family transcriptional regulator